MIAVGMFFQVGDNPYLFLAKRTFMWVYLTVKDNASTVSWNGVDELVFVNG